MSFFQSWFQNPRSCFVRPTTPTVPLVTVRLPTVPLVTMPLGRSARCKCALALMAVFFVHSGNNDCFAQSSEGLTPQTQESSTQVGQIEQEIISEINEIRKSLGGGLSQEFGAMNDSLKRNSKALSNIIGESKPEVPNELTNEVTNKLTNEAADEAASADTLFGQELTRFVVGQSDEQEAVGEAVGEPINEAIEGSDREESHQPASPSHSHGKPASLKSQQQVLWRCARGIEQLAGELEQVEAYENADNLRHQAYELWRKARTTR